MLTKFKLVNTDGLKGLFISGRTIPFEKIDDTMAEQLIKKTHVLERVAEVAVAVATVLVEPAAAEAEPTTAKAKGK